MKTKTLAIVFACAIFTGCSSKPYTIEDNGKTERLALKSEFSIQLDGNPSTGYTWRDITKENNCLKQLNKGQEYSIKEPGKLGSGGTYTFIYQVKSAGQANLTLVYARSWETNTPPIKTFTMKILAGTMGIIESQ